MRVIQVITTIEPDVGGPSVAAVASAVAGRLEDIDATLAFTDHRGPAAATVPAIEQLVAAGVAVRRFPRGRLAPGLSRRWGLNVRLAAWIFRHARRADVLHVHYVWSLPTLAVVVAGRLWRRPVVLTPHESLTTFDERQSRSRLRALQKRWMGRAITRHVTRIAFTSPLELHDSPHRAGTGAVIPLPVIAPGAKRSHGARPAHPGTTFGYLGRIHAKKRLDLLLRAFAEVPEATLEVAGGTAAEVAELRAAAAAAGVEPRVRLLGFLEPASRDAFLDRVDVVVVASEYECLCMAAIEAMSAGVPVIVTERTGVAELVRARSAGWVVPAGDVGALAAAMRRVCDTGVSSRMRANAALAADETYSHAAYAAAIRTLYEQAIEAVGASS